MHQSNTRRGAEKAAEIDNDGRIVQSERLFTARPRSTPKATSPGELYRKEVDSRGQHAFIKLLTSPEQANLYKSGTARNRFGLTGSNSIASDMVHGSNDFGYDRFLLTSVSCDLREKVQIMPTFGDGEVVYYFGREPVVVNISGVLIDSVDNSWFSDWLLTYQEFLRGTQLAKNYELLKLVLPNMTVVGSIMGTSFSQTSDSDVQVTFNFQFLAKEISFNPAVPVGVSLSDSTKLIDFDKRDQFVKQGQINFAKIGSFVNTELTLLTNKVVDPKTSVSGIGRALSRWATSVGGHVEKFKGSIDTFSKESNFAKGLNRLQAIFQTESANLMGVRAKLFSPIYGVLNSLTRLVRNTFGAVTSIFNSIFSPVRAVLRDITNISKQAISLINTVTSSIKALGGTITSGVKGTREDFKTAIKTLGKAAGVVASSPKTVLQSISTMFKGGFLSAGSGFLATNNKASLSSSPKLGKGGSTGSTKAALLSRGTPFDPKLGASV